jgi:hypothetical protein
MGNRAANIDVLSGTLSTLLYPGEFPCAWYIIRADQIQKRFGAVANTVNWTGRIRLMLNSQFVGPALAQAYLDFARRHSINVGAIGVAPYVEPDRSAESQTAWWQADDEQAIDLYIHDLIFNTSQNGYGPIMDQTRTIIDAYNAATGNDCQLYGYEGGVSSAVPIGSNPNFKLRSYDLIYNPNWRIAEQDWFGMLQTHGFSRLNQYAYSMARVGNADWGAYHWQGQPHGRGDGSDGLADNRLTLACPGKPHTKAANVNLDQANVSVRGQAFLDWMKATYPKRTR